MPSQESDAAAGSAATAGNTSAVDALLILFNSLTDAERADAFHRLSVAHARARAGTDSDTQFMLRSLARVGEVAEQMPPTSTQYRAIAPDLIAAGEDIATFGRLYSHFDRSWPNVLDALAMAEETTPRRVQARLASRRLGKIWRYTDAKLDAALEACSAFYVAREGLPDGERYAPLGSEYDWWRERELELARARGDHDHHLPSTSPYRNRFGSWEGALEHFGFTPRQIAERLDRIPPPPRNTTEKTHTPNGLPLAVLTDEPPADLDADACRRLRAVYNTLTPRTRYILTARLGLAGIERLTLRQTGAVLDVNLSTVHLAQNRALTTLATAIPGVSGDPRAHVADLLLRLAAGTTTTG